MVDGGIPLPEADLACSYSSVIHVCSASDD